MTGHVATVVDVDLQWQQWQARGAASDRVTARRMRTVMLLIAAVLIVWGTLLFA